ncbi:hypothetical protein EVAR_103013_1 [Eumeta japonica]|uniref:Uncharacterized protein n=1 Tax=Eumeta variegata TaxID=151549 RepID=A0A4C1WDY1_EUMVA|nr:hypothetical protein EVAR_103013_1 [Eumeta japonica]
MLLTRITFVEFSSSLNSHAVDCLEFWANFLKFVRERRPLTIKFAKPVIHRAPVTQKHQLKRLCSSPKGEWEDIPRQTRKPLSKAQFLEYHFDTDSPVIGVVE